MEVSEEVVVRVLVTGGAGFIGSNLIHALLAEDHEVFCMDDYSRGDHRNLRDVWSNPRFHPHELSIVDRASLVHLFEFGLDVVFHEAALKNTICEQRPMQAFAVNTVGTRYLLQLSIEYGIERFLFASTASVYGRPVLPVLDEGHPTNPISVYGVSKLAAEKFVQIAHERDGLATTILRYFHVYGPRCDTSDETGDVIPIFIRKLANDEPPDIHGDGLQERSYTYVGDVVCANLLAMEKKEAIGKIYNVASGLKISVRAMVEILRLLMGKGHIEPIFSTWRRMPEPRRVTDVSRMRIGYEFGLWNWMPLGEGLKHTIAWYLGEGKWKLDSGNHA